MTNADRDTRAVRLLGVGFAVLFTAALTALLGDLVGAFADSPTTFTYFDSSGERLRHALGAYVLTASGLVFMAFAVRATTSFEKTDPSTDGRTARLTAAAFAALTGLAAAAFTTVSLSVGFGQITGDPGIQEGQELLPQLGYVVLFVPAALSAGHVIFLIARGAARTSRLPQWIIVAGYLVAAAQLFSFYTLPLILLPLWVIGAGISFRPAHAAKPERL
jgi:hypothetical protein